MIIYFRKSGLNKGKITFAFPETFQEPKVEFSIKEGGKEAYKHSDFDYAFLMPEEAYPYEDPRDETHDIHRCRVKVKKSGELELEDSKNKEVKRLVHKKNIGRELKKWEKKVRELKKRYGRIKLKDALKKEKSQ